MDFLEKNIELLECARYGEDEDLNSLLLDGADVNYMDISGSTALHKAAANNELKCLKILYEFNAKYLINHEGNSPLHWAAQNGKTDALKFLLDHYTVDVLAKNSAGRSVLTEAFQSSNTDCIELCLSHESASEERLINLTNKTESTINEESNVESSMDVIVEDESNCNDENNNEVMHTMIFDNDIIIKIRELPITNADNPFGTDIAPEDDTTGLSVWPASIILSHWIIKQSNHNKMNNYNINNINVNRPKVILELGAGCGLPALVAAYSFYPEIVYITDIHEPTLENAVYNAQLNATSSIEMNPPSYNEFILHKKEHDTILESSIQSNEVRSTSLKILNMNWNDVNTYPKEKVDLLLGSDLVYDINILTMLIPTICNILSPLGSLLYCAPNTGRQGMDQFVYALKQVNIICIETFEATSDMYRNILHGHEDNDDAFILHFYDLSSKQPHTLYHFKWDIEYTTTNDDSQMNI